MNGKRITALLAAITLTMAAVCGCGGSGGSGADSAPEETAQKVTPTFMYFVSNSDADFEKTGNMISELESEYSGRVNFNVVNIDEDSEAAKNFPVQGNTPALIMLNTSNDISAMEFQCADKDKLKSDIEAALK